MNLSKPPYFRKFKALTLEHASITMATFLDVLAGVYGDRTCFMCEDDGREISYRQARDFMNRAGYVLKRHGIQPGDRIVVCTSNRIELALICYAVMKIGAIAVPLNFMFKAGEIRYIVENCGARAIVTDAEVFEDNIRDRGSIPGVETWIFLGDSPPAGCISLVKEMAGAPGSLDPHPLGDDDVVGIFYTSGTTGFPKGAMLTNKGFLKQIVRRATWVTGMLWTTGMHTVYHALPLSHMMGFAVTLIMICSAVPIVFSKRFDPQKTLSVIGRRGITIFVGVPAMYAMMLREHPETYNLTSIRAWGSAADVIPLDHIRTFQGLARRPFLGLFRIRPFFVEYYGQVETSGITCIKITPPFRAYKTACVGVRLPGVKLRITDESGKTLGRGKIGELMVKGDNVTKGYWGRQDAASGAFMNDGWFHTGDLARKSLFGFLYFVDREKDVIKSGGYSIFSREVEEELMKHPKVADAAVIGVPHEVKGEVPVAAVVLRAGEGAAPEEILEWAKENIAFYKAPRQVRIVPELPRGMTLKVQKKDLKKLFIL